MHLQTFGKLRLSGLPFRREKPLLLLAYLVAEGPQSRRYLATLFWPRASDPLNSLAVTLLKLRKLGVLDADETRAWTTLSCDLLDFRAQVSRGDHAGALQTHLGPFAANLRFHDLGEELEEWTLRIRESCAEQARQSMLTVATALGRQGSHTEAALLAEKAYHLQGAPEVQPQDLPRFHALLQAGHSPLVQTIEQEARAFQVPLDPPEAPLGNALPGREALLKKLQHLPAGQWAWVQGGRKLGKTTVLSQLHGTLSLQHVLNAPSEHLQGTLVLDDLDRLPDSQLQHLLSKKGPGWSLVASGQGEPPFQPELRVHLDPLLAADLQAFPGLHEQTGGLPVLVQAALEGQDLARALWDHLQCLSAIERQVLLSLGLHPDPARVREALGLSAGDFAAALQRLQQDQLIGPDCTSTCPVPLALLLEQQPTHSGPLALLLARKLSGPAAFDLYRLARPLWEADDLMRVTRLHLQQAETLRLRGQPAEAARVLEEAPQLPEVVLARAWALQLCARFREALQLSLELPTRPEVAALRADLHFRFGQHEDARRFAEFALSGTVEGRAEGHNCLGKLALAQGRAQQAIQHFDAALTLWQMAANQHRWLDTLNNRAIACSLLQDDPFPVFQQVIGQAEGNPTAQAQATLNLGEALHRRSRTLEARTCFEKAIELARQADAPNVLACALNALAVLHHLQEETLAAREAYGQAIAWAQQVGDLRLLGSFMANLAELDHNLPGWEAAISVLQDGGYTEMAARQRRNLEMFMQRSSPVG